ncbi:hypothetical protein Hdeb2414_s0006g00224051 [Helianthus debilis subsp. tardiflorus]
MESNKQHKQGGATAVTIAKPSRFNRICVFCGSSSGKNPVYHQAAIQLGDQLVERKIDLVYGGGSIGLMGLVSKAVFDGGCHVIGYFLYLHIFNLIIIYGYRIRGCLAISEWLSAE